MPRCTTEWSLRSVSNGVVAWVSKKSSRDPLALGVTDGLVKTVDLPTVLERSAAVMLEFMNKTLRHGNGV